MGRWLLVLLAFATLLTSCSVQPTVRGEQPNTLPFKNWKAIRDEGIEKQDTDESCGSASVATTLRSFYGVDVSEQDIAQSVRLRGLEGGTFPTLSRTSFTDLAQAVKHHGFRARGATLRFNDLATLRVPVVVHLRYRGQDHFSVVRGIRQNGLVWLGDPAWGNRKLTAHQFKELWELDEEGKGKILLIVPEDRQRWDQVNSEFFGEPTVNTSMLELISRAPFPRSAPRDLVLPEIDF